MTALVIILIALVLWPQSKSLSRLQLAKERSSIVTAGKKLNRWAKTAHAGSYFAGKFSVKKPELQQASAEQMLSGAATLDLLAACLQAGFTPVGALAAAAPSTSVRHRELLIKTQARLEMNVAAPWQLLQRDPVFSKFALLASRSQGSGTALATGIQQLALQHRSTAEQRGQEEAERAGVLIAGPLALCFLPAFIIVGLVPTVAGLAGEMFAGIGA